MQRALAVLVLSTGLHAGAARAEPPSPGHDNKAAPTVTRVPLEVATPQGQALIVVGGGTLILGAATAVAGAVTMTLPLKDSENAWGTSLVVVGTVMALLGGGLTAVGTALLTPE